ncbi:uncharacterized protein JN550_006817 [Neoarthrinium moseri]|uniref:uncharacterized protein n=1 Tax=Neoarthrinium moseri TaxID=1658444 RepID=UPI001FDC9ED8|nr:uncharacterized protein JN550_006817 [Neoarthrinium moseri]KAI1867676.1 hypothetical protein JN550_006817 [Neoarthrinium moseri]
MPPASSSQRPRQVTLRHATENIESAGSAERLAALDDLRFLFSKEGRSTESPKLTDGDYHRTFDALFRCAISERATYYSGKKGSSTASASRLAKCAEALRVVVEHGASRLKRKTIFALVDHIIQTLPASGDGYVQPLLTDYIKTLVALFSYPANTEVVSTKGAYTWLDCVDFIIQLMEWQLESGAVDSNPSRDSPAPGTAQTSSSLALSTLRSTATSSAPRGSIRVQKNILNHLLECMYLLVSAANAPVLQRSKNITTVVLQCIRLRSLGLSSVLQLGFSILNLVLGTTHTEDTSQTSSLVGELLPLIRQWWQAKTTSQDNALLNSIQIEVLKVLVNIHLNVEHIIKLGDTHITAEIEDFCDMLWKEYSSRDPRAQLQQDDLSYSAIPQHAHALKTNIFSLRTYNLDAERRWAVVHILALFEGILWRQSKSKPAPSIEHDEQPRKRRRTAGMSSRLPQKLHMTSDNVQLTALQVIPFFVTNNQLPSEDISDLLSSLSSLVSHKNTKLAVWAMIAAASITTVGGCKDQKHSPMWKQMWYIAARNLSLASNCRAASILLVAIVNKDILPYRQVSDDINNIVTAADVSGPAVVSDASVALMTRLLQLRNQKLPNASHATCSHVVRWLFLRWDPGDVNSRQSQELDDMATKLLGSAIHAAWSSSSTHHFSETLLQSVRPYLPQISTEHLSTLYKDYSPVLALFSELSESLRERNSQVSSGNGSDAMDLDEDFDSQDNRSNTGGKALELSRRERSILDAESFYVDTTQRLHLLNALHQDPGQIGLVPAVFVEDLLALSDEELLSCRLLNKELLAGDLVTDSEDAAKMIERFGEIIGTDMFSSCEVAFNTCLDIVEGFMDIWTDERTELSSDVGMLYEFFVRKALPSNLLSPKTETALARLLLRLTEINEKFPESLGLPTTIGTIFGMLQGSSIAVKFFIGKHLSRIFHRFVLKTHDQYCSDIIDYLPHDPEVPEGIALRLYVLSELAQHWRTLLRRCVYAIFETPGNIRYCAKHASYCLSAIARTLGLENAQKLFDLFAPQLLYTWLNNDDIENIPFEIFGFSTLEELLENAQTEAVALMVMRGQEVQLTSLAESLKTSPAILVQRCFPKALAYSIAFDISMPKVDNPSGESRIRKMMGRQLFIDNVYISFADIIAIFFTIIDQENPVENHWAKENEFVKAADSMAEIKKLASSDIELAPNQQPHFRAKYLTREIALLCSRTEYELKDLWTPALVVSVARRLFNMIHPALGPLHTCSVIRKVRVLVCLAGRHACESYPLEMLLHSIRPHLTDLESADDALGITQYLLSHGSTELARSPSFLAGYALSTLASSRVFLESSQASTTQESQFKATMSKAQRFHQWFSRYLEEYQSPLLRGEQQLAAFKAITQSAAHVRSSGNSERGSHESTLLLEILRDDNSDAQLLNEPSRQLALQILAKDFKIPASFRQDAINSDKEAKDLATAVWKSAHAQPDDEHYERYRVWAGRVIGRGFAASGTIDPDLLRESKLKEYLRNSTKKSSSERGLLVLLQALAVGPDGFTAGLAEAALRCIVSEAADREDNMLLAACQGVLSEQLLVTSNWNVYKTPPADEQPVQRILESMALSPEAFEEDIWVQRLAIYLAQTVEKDIVLGALPQLLKHVRGFAVDAFPFIVHLVLLAERDRQQSAKRQLSAALKEWLKNIKPEAKDHLSLLVNALLYLRTQKLPGEKSIADRSMWLDVDLSAFASAASRCGMHKTALLLVESAASEGSRTSRRSSAVRAQESTDVLLDIFENIDDPDAYYGLQDNTSLANVLARLEYEKDGVKGLAFRGAQFNSHIRRKDTSVHSDEQYLVGTLSGIGLSGLSHSLLQNQHSHDNPSTSVDSTFTNARRLEIWNLPVPNLTKDPAPTLYKVYQGCHQATKVEAAQNSIYRGLNRTVQNLVDPDSNTASIRSNLCTLAALAELDDVLNLTSYTDVSQLLSTRETTLSTLGKALQSFPKSSLSLPESKLIEARSLLLSSNIYRFHQSHQESLNIATALNDLIEPSLDLGLTIDAAAKLEVANALWDHNEMIPSIRMLQSIDEESDLRRQDIAVRRSDLLAKVAYQISVARLEKPESIQKNYLQPALKELKGKMDGPDAGQVYHQFAMFCDEQLQNPDSLEDLVRLQHLRQGKSDEVTQLAHLIRNTKESQTKGRYQNHLAKAKQWLDLDEQELRRVEQSRSEFVRLSLENYLLSLTASDEHNNDALRFTALWLERSGEDSTNEAVKRYIEKVPTRKFALLMNQLTSRLLDRGQLFQKLLFDLVHRICVDHPYHGMYQVWSGTKSRTNNKDDIAVLRQKATEKVAKKLAQNEAVSAIWRAIDKTNKAYHMLAVERDSSKYKAGHKMPIKDSSAGGGLIASLSQYKIPPPTMQIELSPDRDYSKIPHVIKLEPSMSIASGVSAPKIITLVGSNGQRFKQLVKGGSDDLRQDAIMEQVFSAVSSVLQHHRSTQQRNLGIRTYKVLPLTASSGLIEFVPNTIPLHEYLMPAHERYHPKDLKGSSCRKEISQVQNKSIETRLQTYKSVTSRFQPVMRYFFMEYFLDPDEWFAKRTAYTRTTAAISILGHVLGLGDRHGHNILLDSVTGEVVHIDLGVAFETGRVLPVPELVPFRLTRDIVDGMGVTKTEGVFRRCCEFTLDALREETYSIMTILDVLRYDPLYSWSISPVRMAKLQDVRRDGEADDAAAAESAFDPKRKAGGLVNEPSEADRALEVVRKKLSKTLSVTATVNDLINQAVDERNLAVLYSGWAAYA